MKTLRQIYLVAWALLLSAFVVLTLPKFLLTLRNGRIIAPSPNASMDALLNPLLEIQRPTMVLASRIPNTSRISFISQKNDARCDFVYSAVAYLSWPRKIDKVEVAPNESPPSGAPAFLCGISGADSNAQSLGPHLSLRAP